MKKYLISLLLPVAALCYSCVEDSSAYETQQKEDVLIDDFEKPGDGTETPEPGVLIPGVYEIKINVEQPDGNTVVRRFKYFMPSTLNTSLPVSLVINFHSSIEYAWKVEPSDPIWSVSSSHTLNQTAIKENWITCFPVSGATTNEDGSGQLDWTDTENELAFVDAIVDYFLASSPSVDAGRIYGIGANAGGDFLFQLALNRSEVFAAITPYQSEYSIPGDAVIPARAVPVITAAVSTEAQIVLDNMGKWAARVAGYFANDRVDTENIEKDEFTGYANVDAYTWKGAKADVEVLIFTYETSVKNISLTALLPSLTDFMNAHPLDNATANIFVTVENREIVAQTGQAFEIPFNYTTGATVELIGAPASWQPAIEGKTLKLTAPSDFYGDVARKGEFSIRATLGGSSGSATVRYELLCPKDYFEVGDIYYNSDFEPEGIVVWVNNANIREAKIMSLEAPDPPYHTIQYGALGMDFETPDYNDGAANTAAMSAKNTTLTTPLTSSNSAFIWAANYGYKEFVDGWYMPAINEIASIYSHKDAIAAALAEAGGVALPAAMYSSTTVLGGMGKIIHYFNLSTGVALERDTTDEYTGYIYARAFHKVTK